MTSEQATTTGTTDKWPENLYRELYDMSAMSFLVYTLAYVVDTARKETEGIQGLTGTEGTQFVNDATNSRSFTPKEVMKVIEANRDALQKHYPSSFNDGEAYNILVDNLKTLQERADTADPSGRPLTMEAFDDRYQDRELVYGVARDDDMKRIILVFRGTENELAFGTNWSTNANSLKVRGHVPDTLKSLLSSSSPDPQIEFHAGFYNYVFQPTTYEQDPADFRKYDQIVTDVKNLLKQCPGYKLYVTGHSLGAALSTLVSFYLACDDDIPKPVMNINFASPRLADYQVLEATRALEQAGKLRILRVVNENDSVTVLPALGYYHLGMQLRLYKGKADPVFDYPRKDDGYLTFAGRLWRNSVFASFNFGYDHGDYRERIEAHKDFLTKQKNVYELYKDSARTGFSEST